MQVETEDQNLMSRAQLEDRIAVLCGGRAAEEVIIGSITTGASNDIERATKLARSMVTKYGMSDTYGMMALETTTNAYLGGDSSLICSETTAAGIDQEVKAIISTQQERARQVIRDHRDKVLELTDYLLEKETITGDQFMEILHS